MICNNCGKEHSLIYPESVNDRLRKKMICIECERWLELFDEIQINPAHVMICGVYYVIEPKSLTQVHYPNYLKIIKDNVPYPLYTNSMTVVGIPPKAFDGFFPDNADIMED